MNKLILLDFDGVLVDSNAIKDKAFEYVFAGFPKQKEAILAYHRRTPIIRFDKFRYIYEQILKLPYTVQEQQRLSQEFSAYCINAVSQCPWVKGAEEFLNYFKGRRPMYIVSINPPGDLEAILKARGIRDYFDGVYAVDAGKAWAIKEILAKQALQAREAVFIGDSLGDLNSAREAGVDFIGRGQGVFDRQACPVFDDMLAIMEEVKQR